MCTKQNGIFRIHIPTHTHVKLCDTKDFYSDDQSVLKFGKILISKKDDFHFVKIKEGYLKVLKLPSGRIWHIKKFDESNCIICARNYLFFFNIYSESFVQIVKEKSLGRIVILLF